MTAQELLDRLRAEPSFGRFIERDLLLPSQLGIRWSGCLERKTFNIHRAVVLLDAGNSIPEIAPFVEQVRVSVDIALRARFWRGLGVGLVLFSPQEVVSADLEPATDTIATKTTIVQWLIHISSATNHIAAAHTWCATTTTAIFNFIIALDGAGGSKTRAVVAKPNEKWKWLYRFILGVRL